MQLPKLVGPSRRFNDAKPWVQKVVGTALAPESEVVSPDWPERNLSFLVANIDSLHRNWQALLDLDSDILCLSEIKINKTQLAEWRTAAYEAGYRCFISPTPCERANMGAGGTALFVREHIQSWETVTPQLVKWVQLGRLSECCISFPSGLVAHLVVVYSWSDYPRHAPQAEELFTALASLALCSRGRPLLICGDFNTPADESPYLASFATDLHLVNLPQEAADVLQVPRRPTYRSGSILDHAFANECFATLTTKLVDDHDWIFPSHRHFTFEVVPPTGACPLLYYRLIRPLPDGKIHLHAEFCQAIHDKDVTRAETPWSARWESYMAEQLSLQEICVAPPKSAPYSHEVLRVRQLRRTIGMLCGLVRDWLFVGDWSDVAVLTQRSHAVHARASRFMPVWFQGMKSCSPFLLPT